MDIKQYISSGIIETCLMGLCTPEEERELETLRRQYPELDRAVIACEAEIEKNMLKHTTDPGEAVDQMILSRLDALRPPAPAPPVQSRPPVLLKVYAAAASVLLLISAGLNFYQFRKSKPGPAIVQQKNLPQRDYEILNNPAITPVAMYGVGTHAICRCTMFWDRKTGKLYIMIHHLPGSSASRDYQLWSYVDGKPINTGIIQDDIRGRFIEISNVPADATSFSVTLEKAGGSPEPTVSETYLEGRI